MPSRPILSRHIHRPPFALPAPVDRACEQWWRLPPRARAALLVLAVVALVTAAEVRVAHARSAWGGPPRQALIAVRDTMVGEHPQVRSVDLPPALVPPDAPQRVADDARLAFALPQATVLTRAHLTARGPAAGLPAELRVVPMPVDPGWDVRSGGWVDVWALTASGTTTRIAVHRPVVAVLTEDDPPTALVGLADDEVAAAMRGLAGGQILLTHAPP